MPFKKGQSGNPTGRPKHNKGLVKRQQASKLYRLLLKLAQTSKSEAVQVRAAQLLIEHEVGRPPMQTTVTVVEKYVMRLPNMIEEPAAWEAAAAAQRHAHERELPPLFDAPAVLAAPLPPAPAVGDPRAAKLSMSATSADNNTNYAADIAMETSQQAQPNQQTSPSNDSSFEHFAATEGPRRHAQRLRNLEEDRQQQPSTRFALQQPEPQEDPAYVGRDTDVFGMPIRRQP
jgi:Family of unknown function (DUF5681)